MINPLDIFIDITQGFDWLWSHQKKLCYGLSAIALVLMTIGTFSAEFWPFAIGIAVCLGSTVAAFVIGHDR